MPAQVSYPGVYIEEIDSGNSTVTGVATAITAFIGRAPQGPVDDPITITSMASFQQRFGGVTLGYPLTYAVKDFFQNGGSEAIIVRRFIEQKGEKHFAKTLVPLANKDKKAKAEIVIPNSDKKATCTINGFTFTSKLIGEQGNKTKIKMEKYNAGRDGENLKKYIGDIEKTAGNLFNLTVTDEKGIDVIYQCVTFVKDKSNNIIKILLGEKKYCSGEVLVAKSASSVINSVEGEFSGLIVDVEQNFTGGTNLHALTLEALDGGALGNAISIKLDKAEEDGLVAQAKFGNTAITTNLFNLSAIFNDNGSPVIEEFKYLTLDISNKKCPNYVGNALLIESGSDPKTPAEKIKSHLIRFINNTVVINDLVNFPKTVQMTGGEDKKTPTGITLIAKNPGTWANDIKIAIDTIGISDQVADIYTKKYKQHKLSKEDLFNFSIIINKKVVESYQCVTVKGENDVAIRLDKQLKQNSILLSVDKETTFPINAKITALTFNAIAVNKNAITYNVDAKATDSALLAKKDDYLGDKNARTGLYALENVDIFNTLCIPPDDYDDGDKCDEALTAINADASAFCESKRAIFITEPLRAWTKKASAGDWSKIQPTDLGINGESARYACSYFPNVRMADANMDDHEAVFSNCGVIAGIFAKNDLNRGIWTAPAGQTAGMVGVKGLEVAINDADNGQLNPLGINCLRNFPVVGPVVWGDRTLRGADMLSDDYKYLSVRRLTNYIELSLQRGTQWAVFESNDESLWSQLRLSIGGFMGDLAKQGAFYSYKVICDGSTTTPDDIDKGIVNVSILFSPVKPAEFVVLKFQQTAATV